MQGLARTPVDIAMVAVKSYDTLWATALIAPYLSERGFVVSLQNCMNEETIAGVVGWGRTLGAVASLISVDLYEPGRIRRTIAKGGDKYTIFRIGEPHGRITPRIEELVRVVQRHRQRQGHHQPVGRALVEARAERHGQWRHSATGLTSGDCLRDPKIRRFQIALAAEAIRVGQALGYPLEKVRGMSRRTTCAPPKETRMR